MSGLELAYIAVWLWSVIPILLFLVGAIANGRIRVFGWTSAVGSTSLTVFAHLAETVTFGSFAPVSQNSSVRDRCESLILRWLLRR